MQASVHKTDVIRKLKSELLLLQGFRRPSAEKTVYTGLHTIEKAFPQKIFPTGAIHSFSSLTWGDAAATNGFIAGLLGNLILSLSAQAEPARLNLSGGRSRNLRNLTSTAAVEAVWVNGANIYPPALKLFGIDPEKIVFINTRKPKEALWVVEEALKCESLVAVMGELRELSFTESRRLQLAVEKSGVTGFINRHNPRGSNPIACAANWKITSAASVLNGLPGVGFPCWNVDLIKVRNGKPGKWLVEWHNGHFKQITKPLFAVPEYQTRNTG